jgi:hypothetical protein
MCLNSFRFKNGDLEIEFSGERIFVETQVSDWKSFMQQNQARPEVKSDRAKSLPEPENNPGIRVKKNISINDFIKLKAPGNETDKTIVAAYYLERYEKYNSFTGSDINKLVNISDTEKYLAINMEKGFLALCDQKTDNSSYTLTYSGEIYVREGLQE